MTKATKAPAAQVDAARREIELGADATREVGQWTRLLVSDEVSRGGELAQAATLIGCPQWPNVVRETFSDLYGSPGDVAIEPSVESAGSPWVRRLLETMTRVPEWTDLQAKTRGDEWASGLAVANVAGRVYNELSDHLPSTDDRSARDTEQALRDMLDEAQESAGGVPTRKTAQAIDTLREAIQKAADDTFEAETDADESAESLGNINEQRIVRSLVATAAAEASAEIDSMRAALRGTGAGSGAGAGFAVRAPARELIDAMRSGSKLRRVMELAGRLRAEAAAKQKSKTTYARDEVASVTTGNDLARLLPSELVYLADDDLEMILFRKLSERAALEYELRGRETMTRGPIVLCVDESGSMSGSRDEWAKAVTLALADVACKQRREFVIVHFDDAVTKVDRPDVRAGISLAELLTFVSHFSGGGTNIERALMAALGIVRTAKGGLKDANVILISDGADDSAARGAALAGLKEDGVSIHGVAIDSGFDACLRGACASYVSISKADFDKRGAVDAILSI